MAIKSKVLDSISRVKSIDNSRRVVNIIIKSNGKEDRENPAYYGPMHDNGNYPFSKGALENILDVIDKDEEIQSISKSIVLSRVKGNRAKTKDLDSLAKRIGEIGRDEVVDYILYDMPQKPQPWKGSFGLNLVETGELLDSIDYNVKRR